MRPYWIQISILLHFLSHGVVEPRIRQASPVISNGSSTPLPVNLPKVVRKRRKSTLELIQVQGDGDGDGQRSGIMNEQQEEERKPPNHPQNLNIEGLNQAIQHNQIQFMGEAPKLDFLIKERHEKPNLLQQLNERNKQIEMEEIENPEALFRSFSMSMEDSDEAEAKLTRSFSMSMAPDVRDVDLSHDPAFRQFSMSMSMPARARSSGEEDSDAALAEETLFYLRQGASSMGPPMSMESRAVVNQASQETTQIPVRPRSINLYQMQGMSMTPSAPSAPSTPSAPTMPSTGSPAETQAPATTPSPTPTDGRQPPDTLPTLAPNASSGGPTDAPVPTISPVPTSPPVPTVSPAPSAPVMPDRTLAPTEEGTNQPSSSSRYGVSTIPTTMIGVMIVLLGWLA